MATWVDRSTERRWETSVAYAALATGVLVLASAFLLPAAAPLASAVAGLGLAACGLLITRIMSRARFDRAERDGLVEELSQEFDGVKERIEDLETRALRAPPAAAAGARREDAVRVVERP